MFNQNEMDSNKSDNYEKKIENVTRAVPNLVKIQEGSGVNDNSIGSINFVSCIEHEYDTNFYYDPDDSVKNNDCVTDQIESVFLDKLNIKYDDFSPDNYVDSNSRAVTSKGSNLSSTESISFEDKNTKKSDGINSKIKPILGDNIFDEQESSISSALIKGISLTFKVIEKSIGVPKLEKLQGLRESIIGNIKSKVYSKDSNDTFQENDHKSYFPVFLTPNFVNNECLSDETQSKESILSTESIRYSHFNDKNTDPCGIIN
ncbi:hypothetical protein FG379_002266 [Cryptosporidium bovis]|uniref:uncharacterized protein n=1 Tax=Cryptosporidium bovis TaxID=310047 RepID=UPI003519E208|nr:hypothetical protein FG379_002266 [Cryptosporidium bovis]